MVNPHQDQVRHPDIGVGCVIRHCDIVHHSAAFKLQRQASMIGFDAAAGILLRHRIVVHRNRTMHCAFSMFTTNACVDVMHCDATHHTQHRRSSERTAAAAAAARASVTSNKQHAEKSHYVATLRPRAPPEAGQRRATAAATTEPPTYTGTRPHAGSPL